MPKKTIVTSVISSLIASTLFFIFLQPILRYTQETVNYISNNIYSTHTEFIYQNAAFGLRSYVPIIVYRMLVSFLWMLYAGFIGLAVGVLTALYALKSKRKPAKAIINAKWVTIIVIAWIYILTFGWLLYMSYHGIIFYSDIQMNVSFNKRLSILAPYLSEEQEEGLTAMWASMTSRADYENINAELENYAEQFNVEVPEPLWK